MRYVKSLTHDCPQTQGNISEQKVLLRVLLNRPQQPRGSMEAPLLQRAVRNFPFKKEKELQLHHPACFKCKQADSTQNRKAFEIQSLYSGLQVNLQFSRTLSSQGIHRTALL